jgi:UDP-N-acetylmuramoyl-L-alanyl-D-glutamate--2,6-diaminopimelate ligase
VRLDQLLDDVEVLRLDGDPATDVRDVAYVSSAAHAGALFCCIRGARSDGHDHAPDALAHGAVALVVERALDVPARAQVHVPNARAAMAPIAAAFHGHPSERLRVVGVTGTNGKSTTTLLVKAILDRADMACGVIGTLNSARTTPEAPELQARLASFVADGKRAAAVEVSSVGLVQHRVDATRFACAIFTNLSPDELAIHGSMQEYFEAKAMLFASGRADAGAVNADDEWGRRLLDRAPIPLLPFSMNDAEDLDIGERGARFRWRGARVALQLDGAFNVANALGAATACAQLGVDVETIAQALTDVEPVPGHGERVDAGQPFPVIVDYAHTAGALAAVLGDARRATAPDGRVIVVFGCGGDRDPGRRGPMGEAAATNADVVVVTSDNPRTESPLAIIDAIVAGARPRGSDLRVVEDRAAAIELAVREARQGDVVVVAGKGPEQGQVVGEDVLPFDDRVIARNALRSRGFGGDA